jgi:hypothetical protein
VIAQGALQVADGIRAAVALELPGTVVAVTPAEPETAAAPCIWLRFLEARYGVGRWTVTYEATVVADAALGALDAQAQLGALTDAVLAADVVGVITTDMVARGGGLTARIGEAAHPCTIVTIPQLTQAC